MLSSTPAPVRVEAANPGAEEALPTRRPVSGVNYFSRSIGARRQELSKASDPAGSGKLYNAVVTELMQCIDHYWRAQGFVIMAATNSYEGLHEAVIRDSRFDEKIGVDIPDEAERVKSLTAQLARRVSKPFRATPSPPPRYGRGRIRNGAAAL